MSIHSCFLQHLESASALPSFIGNGSRGYVLERMAAISGQWQGGESVIERHLCLLQAMHRNPIFQNWPFMGALILL
jgi:hypothetical protein